jgi:hypothetical protein
MLISTALLLDNIIRNSVCTPAKLPCRRVEVGYKGKLRPVRDWEILNCMYQINPTLQNALQSIN